MVGSLFAQYKYGRIELQDGTFIEGRKLYITQDDVSIHISKRSNRIINKSDVKTVWKGMPSIWEIRKGSIIGTSIGLTIGIVDGTSLGSEDSGAFGMIPLLGLLGYVFDLSSNSNKYRDITDNWQIVWNSAGTINNSKVDKYSELEKLFNLKEKGIITNEEYEKKKSKILELD